MEAIWVSSIALSEREREWRNEDAFFGREHKGSIFILTYIC